MQDCKYEKGKKFELKVHGICDIQSGTFKYPTVKKSPIRVVNKDMEDAKFEDCEINLEYKSVYACPTQLPTSFINTLSDFMGAFFILYSFLMCFFGNKFIVLYMAIVFG